MTRKERLKAIRDLHTYAWRVGSEPLRCLECGQLWPCQSYLLASGTKAQR